MLIRQRRDEAGLDRERVRQAEDNAHKAEKG